MDKNTQPTTLYPAPAVAQILGEDRQKVHYMALRGQLESVQESPNGRVYITRNSLVGYIDRGIADAQAELDKLREIRNKLENEK